MNRDSRRLRLVLALLVLTSFTLLTIDYRSGKGGPFGAVRKVADAVFGPLESGVSAVTRPIGHLVSDVVHSGGQGSRIRSLQNEVQTLQGQLRAKGDATRETAELTQLVALAGSQHFKIIPAQVVGSGDVSGFDDTVTLNVGTHDGIRVDMTVISSGAGRGGLVGRVITASPYSSQVAVIVDPDVVVSSRLQHNAQIGLTSGHGTAALTFTPKDPTVRPADGDIVETFGSPEYPGGIPIGTVTSVAPTRGLTTLTAQVTPFIDYTALDVVGVVVQPSRTTPAAPILPTVTVRATVTVTATPRTSTPGSGAPTTPGSAGGVGLSPSTPVSSSRNTTPTSSAPPGGG